MKSLTAVVSLCIGFAIAGSAMAQTFTGGVRGAVKEAGGVIPGVTVELINEGTGTVRDAVTNDSGEYNFAAVPPGTYTIRAALTGFKTYENKAVRVQAQQFITLDISLEVGTLQETITVTGQAPLIDTSNASGGGVIDNQQLVALPSAGRSAFLFAVTLPTVVASGDAQFNRQQDQTNASLLSLGGGTRRGNNYLLDGVPITDLRNRASAMPSLESVENVAVQVHTYDAETGRTGGGIFNTAMKSGTNAWRGSGFYQTRPRWGASNNYFNERAVPKVPLPETYFHLGGGGFGGPIIHNRTFFWFTSEGYGSNTTRNSSLRLPTQRERNGDFSESTDAQGRQVVIYDPLTGDANGNGRTPFPGNIIPADRINAVGRNMMSFLPLPTRDVSNGNANFESTAQIHDRAQMYTGKVDHRFSDSVSLTGFYLYNKTDEPCANYLEPGLTGANRFIDRNDYLLKRRVNVLALNNTWVPGNNSVLTLRYGWTRFIDDDTLSIDFDPASLGFAPSFIDQLQVDKFPRGQVIDYYNFGAQDPTPRNWYSWSANGTFTRLMGSHTLKFGGDYRLVGIKTQSFAAGAGDFRFDRLFTSQNPLAPVNGATPSGNATASMLLGYPSGDPANLTSIQISNPFNAYVHYYGFYAQDDWRVSPKLTFNYGLRLEHESGLMEENDSFTVGFDRDLTPPGPLGNVVVNGQPVRGGLMYACQNGNPCHQGDPPGIKPSPRVGFVYSFNPKTVLRAGYGIYWSPWNYQAVGAANYGQIGFSQNTFIQQNQFRPNLSLTNPFPQGLSQPVGNSLGALTGVGSQIEFIDQDKKAPYVQQYSIDVNRELRGNVAVGFEYSGATGRDLGLGGSNDGVININQLDPRHLALGSALLEQVPNPFFGLPAGQGKSVTSPTIQRRELLRPFPQFNDILMRQNTSGRNQYHAAIFKFEKRVSNGWGARVNYTRSRLKDNQFGETNFFSQNTGANAEAQDAYNLDAEYAISLLDVPHKLVFSPIFELPFGEGRRWLTSGVGALLLGNWTITSILSLESGFPVAVRTNTNTANIFTRNQRPNLSGTDPNTSGSRDDRLLGNWISPDGFTLPGQFELGTAPRTLADVRTPHRNNWDFVATKAIRFGDTARGEIRLEVLNLNNIVKTTGPQSLSVGAAQFGQIRTQSGFMRLTQLMFRFSF